MTNTSHTYDIIIVGGRVAGAATAIGLSRHNYRILLLERAAMPSDTLSTHFLWPDGVAALRRLGVLEEMMAGGLPEIHHFQSWEDDGHLTAGLVEIDGVAFGICPRRTVLDGVLFERATASPGVRALDRARVTGLLWDDGRVAGVRYEHEGETIEAPATFVIGADGRNSLVAREAGAGQFDVTPAGRYWYYAYFRGATPPEPAESFIVSSTETSFIGSAPTNDGLQMVLYGANVEGFDAFRRDHEANYLDAIKQHHVGALMLERAGLASPVSGIAGVEGYFRQAHGPGWALVGDALHQKDPIAGRGVNEALRGAELLASALAAGIEAANFDRYAGAFRESVWPKYQLTRIVARADLYRTDAQAALMAERIVSDDALTEFMRLWYDDRATFDDYFRVGAAH